MKLQPAPPGRYASRRAEGHTPCIRWDMDDDTAIILMVDSNCQREHILPSEKAKAYQMKLEAINRKLGRPSKNNSAQVGTNFRADEVVAQGSGESRNQVQRFMQDSKAVLPLGTLTVEETKAPNGYLLEGAYAP